jgi:hypothetical protein
MAVPYEVFVVVVVGIVMGLLVAWRASDAITSRLWARAGGSADAKRRARHVRTGCGLVFAVVLVSTVGARWLGAPLAPADQPLQFGHASVTGGPALIASTSSAGDRSDDYAYAPGAEIRDGITLENNGDVPLTVTGLANDSIPFIRSLELRLPSGPLTQDIPPLYPNGGSATWASEPFHPFEIPAHGEVGLALDVTVGTCSTISPVPTLAAGASLIPDDPSFWGALTAVSELHVEYEAFGLARTATIELPFREVVIGGREVTGCPPSQSASMVDPGA